MALQLVDLGITQGEDFSRTWLWASPDPSGLNSILAEAYYNFINCAARMAIRYLPSALSTLLASLSTGGGQLAFTHGQMPGGPPDPGAGAPNGFVATITKATSLTWSPGIYYFDLFVDLPNGTSTEFVAGRVLVAQSNTR